MGLHCRLNGIQTIINGGVSVTVNRDPNASLIQTGYLPK
jgi:hypothetical protein